MNKIVTSIILLTLSFTTLNAFAAVNIVECEDQAGNKSFQKVCPPGSNIVGETKFSTGKNDDDEAVSDLTVTLYSVPDCDTCDEVKEFLQNRKISITEKDVNSNINFQNELKELTGALKIPCVIIGENTIVGYNRKELKDALSAAGYNE